METRDLGQGGRRLGVKLGAGWFSRGCRIENLREEPVGVRRGNGGGAVPEKPAFRGEGPCRDRAPSTNLVHRDHDPHQVGKALFFDCKIDRSTKQPSHRQHHQVARAKQLGARAVQSPN